MKKIILIIAAGVLLSFSCSKGSNEDNIIIKTGENESIKIKFFPNSKNIEEVSRLIDDSIKNGETIYFYENGKIMSKVNYKDNKIDGPAYYFYNSGYLDGLYLYSENNKIDDAYDYYDGRLNLIKNYLFYNQEGHLIYKATYDERTNLIKEEGENPFR